MMTTTTNLSTKLILSLTALFILLFVSLSPVNHSGSDPRASLLLSQTIINDKSIKLDSFKDSGYGNVIYEKNNHYYYYFPLGTSLSSIPFVWIETKIFKLDMNNRKHDAISQKVITALVSTTIFLLLYLIAKMYLKEQNSIAIAFLFWASTSLSSSLGQALWSQSFASLYALLSLFLVLKIIKENKNNLWIFLAMALFMSYLSRPTMSLLSIALVLFLFSNHKKIIALKITILISVLLSLFVLFSLYEFKQLLPDYYLPKRLASDTFWTALYGNLFSPARGIFIFSSFLFIFIFNFRNTFRVFSNDKSLLIILLWILLHTLVISKFPHWWAGWSYGSRFMIDVLPGIYLLFIIYLATLDAQAGLLEKKIVKFFLVFTLLLSIYFNAIQGLYNKYTSTWNAAPNIDQYPEYLFNWKYPQFLHNKKNHIQRINEHEQKKINDTISFKWDAKELPSQVGSVLENNRTAIKDKDKQGYITFGPYIELSKGVYRFDIVYNSPTSTNTKVGNWDIVVNMTSEIKQINSGDINGTNAEEQHIKGTFRVEDEHSNKKIEIRNFYNGVGDLSIKKLIIDKVE